MLTLSVDSLDVCIVMDYYPTGDLEQVLKSQRVKETALPEYVVYDLAYDRILGPF